MTEKRDGRLLTLSLNDRFGSSLLLLPDYWMEMAHEGQILTAAIPRQDELIVIVDVSSAELAELRQRVSAIHADTTDRTLLSTDLFRGAGDDWQVLPP